MGPPSTQKQRCAWRRAEQAKSPMRMREAIKFLGSSKKVICLPRGNPRDLFPVLETVSPTHSGFYPHLLTRSKAMPRDDPRTGPFQKTTTKVVMRPHRFPRAEVRFTELSIHSGTESQAFRCILLLFFLRGFWHLILARFVQFSGV